jgi:hypothetical protein
VEAAPARPNITGGRPPGPDAPGLPAAWRVGGPQWLGWTGEVALVAGQGLGGVEGPRSGWTGRGVRGAP